MCFQSVPEVCEELDHGVAEGDGWFRWTCLSGGWLGMSLCCVVWCRADRHEFFCVLMLQLPWE
jgi:hypothetical protein